MYKETIFLINEKTGWKIKRCVYICDECGNEYRRSNLTPTTLHFCCKDCYTSSQRSGKAKENLEKHFLETIGVKNPYASRGIIDARTKHLQEKYGVENVSQIQDVKDKKAETFFDHYGTTNNFGRQEVREKRNNVMLEKYGTIAASTHPDVKRKLRSHEVKQKRFNTLKKNGNLMQSGPEKRLISIFQSIFDDIKTHITINGWSIDFYILSIDTYFQVDGVFWHGLNRTLEVIQEKAKYSRIDKEILNKFNRDQQQNIWFKENNMKLVRITDLEINAMNDEQLFSYCNSYMM
jgi:hypothetical protein